MALKIRLRKQGRINRPFYRIIVADARNRRDGKYVECLGWYNPFEEDKEKGLKFDAGRLEHWLGVGAQLSDNTEKLAQKAAPDVMKVYNEKLLAKQAKRREQRRASRKRKSEAAKATAK